MLSPGLSCQTLTASDTQITIVLTVGNVELSTMKELRLITLWPSKMGEAKRIIRTYAAFAMRIITARLTMKGRNDMVSGGR